jgi:dihydroorotase
MNTLVLRNARIIDPSRDLDETGTIIVKDRIVAEAGAGAMNQGIPDGAVVRDCSGLVATPGLIDARVFTGEPGAEHRETIASAGRAAAAGGITAFIMMPDTDPVIDDIALVEFVRKNARDASPVHIYPAAALTKGLSGEEMTEIGLLKDAGAVAFSNGRVPLHNAQVLRRALTYAREFGTVISLEPRDRYLGAEGVIDRKSVV